MTVSFQTRPDVHYRGYSLQAVFASPQWRVSIASMVVEMPELAPEKRIVRGWNEEEVLQRAKVRVDDLIESQPLH